MLPDVARSDLGMHGVNDLRGCLPERARMLEPIKDCGRTDINLWVLMQARLEWECETTAGAWQRQGRARIGP